MTKYFILAVLFIFMCYGIIKALPLIEGPSLSVDSPQNNATLPDGIVVISGNTAHAAQLTLDGAPMLHEEDGDFSATLAFPRGGSELTFVATDLFGRKATIMRTIFVP